MIACLKKIYKITIINPSEGFTLLELIIVFTVIAVISTMGIASFVSYSRNQALVQAGSSLENTLNLARSNSLSQVKPSVCTGNILSGYQVDLDTLNNKYTLSVVCLGLHTIQTTSLPNGITFSSQTTASSIFFPVISSGVTGGGTKIVLTGYSKNFTVNIDTNGIIR